jgi:hypothetical protein
MQNAITKAFKFTLIAVLLIGFNKVSAQAPTITSFTPTSGSVGTLVTITGANLNNIDTIKIGGVSAIKISATSTSFVAMVMPGAITGTIYLANSKGNVTSLTNFTKVIVLTPFAQQGNKLVGTAAIGTDVYQGASVAVSADGNTAIVGGPFDNYNIGAAWIYFRHGSSWTQQGSKLVGTGAIGPASQGTSVSISADGNTALVSGSDDNSSKGAVWVYTWNGSSWTQQGNKLVGTDASIQSYHGTSVSISADGNTAIVGGYNDNGRIGAAWVYTRSGGIWTQQGSKLEGTGANGLSKQGYSVSISADGNTAIVGGYSDNNYIGAAWVFTRSGSVWSQQGSKLVGTGASQSQQGYSVSLSADGNRAIVGGNNDNGGNGAAWVYIRNGSTWTQQGSKLTGTGASGSSVNQGTSVSISADGNTALVGGPGDNNNIGAAWLFTRNSSTWIQQGSKLVGAGASGSNVYQSISAAISADGNTAIIGGVGDNNKIGAAWLFSSSPASFVKEVKINNIPQLLFYPNPSTGFVTISSSQTIANINVFGVTGKLVYNETKTNKQNNSEIDFSLLDNGIYFIQVVSENGDVSISKIVISK